MCNELLKNAVRFHFCDICRSLYTLPCDSARVNFHFAYNSVSKGTKDATNCLKMHFVSIFATSAEVFIRCAVILAPRFFNLRIKIVLKRTRQSKIIRCLMILAHSNFHFAYNSILKGTRYAMNCLKMYFVSIFTTSAEVFIRCAVIPAHRIFILRIIPFPKELDVQ